MADVIGSNEKLVVNLMLIFVGFLKNPHRLLKKPKKFHTSRSACALHCHIIVFRRMLQAFDFSFLRRRCLTGKRLIWCGISSRRGDNELPLLVPWITRKWILLRCCFRCHNDERICATCGVGRHRFIVVERLFLGWICTRVINLKVSSIHGSKSVCSLRLDLLR